MSREYTLLYTYGNVYCMAVCVECVNEGQFTLAHQSKQDIEKFLVSENVQGIACFGVDDRQTMDLMINQHLYGIIEAGGRGEENMREEKLNT